MASKTIEQFLETISDKGIKSSEYTVRRKLNLIKCVPEDLQDVFTQAFVIKMLQDGFEASVFEKVKHNSIELKISRRNVEELSAKIIGLENEVQSLKNRLERLENTGKVVSVNEGINNSLGQDEVEKYCQSDDGLKPWERAFNAPQYSELMSRYRSIPETDDCHIVNWIANLSEDERLDFYDYAKMDWDNPNHPRFR